MNMSQIIEMQNEIDFLYKENKMLSQKVEDLQKQNQQLEMQIANVMSAYSEMKTKCTELYGNH